MKPTTRMAVYYYALRIGCFAWTMFFTFQLKLWPVALIGWISLGVLFCLDFF